MELAPGQLGAERVCGCRQVGEQRPRMQLAVLERDRQVRGAVEVGPVAVGGVGRQAVAQELVPAAQCRGLAGGREADVGRRRRGMPSERRCAHGLPVGRGAGRAQPWSSHARRNGVNTWNGLPRLRPQQSGSHRVRGAGRDQRQAFVATTTVRFGRGGDVHRVGADLVHHCGHDVARTPVPHHEPPAQGVVERAQGRREVRQPRARRRWPRAPDRRRTAAPRCRRRPARPRPRRAATGCRRGAGRGGTSGSSAPGDGSRDVPTAPDEASPGVLPGVRATMNHERRRADSLEARHPARGTRGSSAIRSVCSRSSTPSCGSGSATTGCAPSCCST